MFIRSNTVISFGYSEEIRNSHEDCFCKLAILECLLKTASVGWRILSNIVKLKYFLNFRDNNSFTNLSDPIADKRLLEVTYIRFSNLAMFNQGHKYVNIICKLTFSNFYVAFKRSTYYRFKANQVKVKMQNISKASSDTTKNNKTSA